MKTLFSFHCKNIILVLGIETLNIYIIKQQITFWGYVESILLEIYCKMSNKINPFNLPVSEIVAWVLATGTWEQFTRRFGVNEIAEIEIE